MSNLRYTDALKPKIKLSLALGFIVSFGISAAHAQFRFPFPLAILFNAGEEQTSIDQRRPISPQIWNAPRSLTQNDHINSLSQLIDRSAFPLSAVGRLYFVSRDLSRFQICTATLVGPHLALTANHCIEFFNQNGGTITFQTFCHPQDQKTNTTDTRPKLIQANAVTSVENSGPYHTRSLTGFNGSEGRGQTINSDWALIELDPEVDLSSCGWIPIAPQRGYPNRQLSLHSAGFGSYLQTPVDLPRIQQNYQPVEFMLALDPRLIRVRQNCHRVESPTYNGIFFHDCDTTIGDSGGPLLASVPLGGQNATTAIVGLHIMDDLRTDNNPCFQGVRSLSISGLNNRILSAPECMINIAVDASQFHRVWCHRLSQQIPNSRQFGCNY